MRSLAPRRAIRVDTRSNEVSDSDAGDSAAVDRAVGAWADATLSRLQTACCSLVRDGGKRALPSPTTCFFLRLLASLQLTT